MIDASGGSTCVGKRHLILYGALDHNVASVRLRLSGGRSLLATRFDPVPDVDPAVGYWVASTRSRPRVLSVTALTSDGSVLRRIVNPIGDEQEGCGRQEFRGRRFLIARGSLPPLLGNWTLHAYRRDVRDSGQPTRKAVLCIASTGGNVVGGGSSSGESCGERLSGQAKAFALQVDAEGCKSDTTLLVHGMARRRVARMVLKSRVGWTLLPLVKPPAWLRLRSRFFAGAVKVGNSSSVVVAQDRAGRDLARYRIPGPRKPIRVRGQDLCGSGFLVAEARSGA